MAIDTETPPANPIVDFEEFFKNYEEVPNEPKYRKKISEAYSRNEHFITVLFEDLLNFRASLANYIKKNPEQALEEAVEAFKNLYRIDSGGIGLDDQDRPYFVRIATQNNSGEVKLQTIRAEHIDHLIFVRGIVIRVSKVNPQIINAAYECTMCGNIMTVPQIVGHLQNPRDCSNPNCQNKKDFLIRTDDSKFIDYQKITLQENPEELRPGSIPQTLHVVLLYNLVDTVRPGERVKVMGILKSYPTEDKRGKNTTLFNTQLVANNIEGLTQIEDEGDLSIQDVEEIRSLARQPGIQKKIARSIARTISGNDHLKMAAAFSLFGGNEKHKKDGSKIRGDIHVLFMGDPGTGKSQILQNCAQIATRAIYTSGKGASAAGLTAAVVRESDNTGLQLEAGALVLASGGSAMIDEFDKMKESDRSAIHEALEQQTVSISKAGIVATLQAKTAVMAAANPKNGRYDDYKSASENINLSPPILTRFDLIFIVRDKPDRNGDDKIAGYILASHMDGYTDTYLEDNRTEKKPEMEENFIPMELFKKYIRYAKNTCHPKLTNAVADKIKEFYVHMRNSQPENSNAIAIVARNLEGIIRMCEANAKMALRDFVNDEDVTDVIELVKKSLRDVGYDAETGVIDMDRILTGTTRNKQAKLEKILEKMRDLQKELPKIPLTMEDIYTPLASDGIDEKFLSEAIAEFLKNGTIYEPKSGSYFLSKSTKEKGAKKGKHPKEQTDQDILE